ncbi:hypothetical protein GGX14DRAFT_103655 [Mycena pura]|uniref:Uncharacterized protein n=1 Tax=Mycena pura TaxID=153505 RepID=A0AAD6YRR3_9AGAR|nr:hypothetical protein GGX14DRAFT_103655 [Mycena pura]
MAAVAMSCITLTQLSLSSLEDWSFQHIRDVFEAPTDELSRQAIDATFAADRLQARVNGTVLDYAGLIRSVLAMRQHSPGGLRVEWTSASAVPDDATNRNGSLVGAYIIRGIWKPVEAAGTLSEFERHKKINVRIESQSLQLGLDSRRIVKLEFVGLDVPVA